MPMLAAADYSTLVTALTTAAQDIADSCISAIAAVTPIALVVVGAVVVITVGIRVFKTVVRK